ncbi:MAG: BamA/TamA family outer membrane protein, partial [Methylobacteriaceae bacterium]|nr:BamA/TamA family outer membrane protein [Methylobacteriaceae bacterium]
MRGLVAASLALASVAGTTPVRAFSFFGLFGDEDPPTPSAASLPYAVTFETRGDDGQTGTLRDASTLQALRDDAPPDSFTLVARARGDLPALVDALWAQGYYNAQVLIEVAGVPLSLTSRDDAAATRAADAYRDRAAVPVRVTAETGPLFTLRQVAVLEAGTRLPVPPEDLPPRIVQLNPGDPARAPDLRAALARIVDWYRAQGHPLVKVAPPEPVVDHAAQTVDVAFLVAPGPKAGFGAVAVSGPERFDPRIVRSFLYLEPGQPYSPKAVEDTRRSIASIPAVGSVRIREADGLDPDGNLPLFVTVTDRPDNLIGASGGYSTLDGPNGRVYYENRNLFGGAERLRLQGDLFLAPRVDGTRLRSIGDFKLSDLGRRVSASFLKPALGGSRVDLLVDAQAERNRVGGGRFGGYTLRDAGGTAALRYRVDDALSASFGFKGERGRTTDAISAVNYGLFGLPLGVRFDSTDNALGPTTGVRVNATLTPYLGFDGRSFTGRPGAPVVTGGTPDFTRATLAASGYLPVDEDGRVVL